MSVSTRKLRLGLAFTLLLIVTLACGASPTVVPPTVTLAPTETPPPTQTPPPLYLSVNLVASPYNESGQQPLYKAEAQIPTLQGSSDDRATRFNNEMIQLTQEEIAKFKDNARQFLTVPGSTGSSYDQKFTLLSPPGNFVSIKIDIDIYIESAPHPTLHTRVVNFDLEAGQNVTLEELFLPNSGYLQMIADICIAQLKTRNIDFQSFSTGAAPVPENYGSWNVTPDGLLITFDEYQVAAYAAGPQLVTIPYSDLKSIIDPHGPLGQFIQ